LKIGITGKARSGKNQFAEYLITAFNHKQIYYESMAFATQLKTMCRDHFGLSDDQLWERGKNLREIPDERFDKDECIYWTPREIMQELGSFYRKIKSDYWVYALDQEIKKRNYDNVIITDVRHLNECAYIKENKGILIKITRNEVAEIHGMDHESETALNNYKDFDIEIKNDGTLDDLYEAARKILPAIMKLEKLMERGEMYNGK